MRKTNTKPATTKLQLKLKERAKAKAKAAKVKAQAKAKKALDAAADETSLGPGDSPPVVEIPESDLRNEVSVLAALITAGLARYHTEAKRLFREEGISVNGVAVTSDKAKLSLADVTEGVIRLSLGKKRHVLLKSVS